MLQTVQKNNNNNLHMDRQCKKTTNNLHMDRQCKKTTNNLHMDRQCKKTTNNLHMDRQCKKTTNNLHMDRQCKKTALEHLQCSRQCKKKIKIHMDSTYLQTVQKTMCKIHIHILSTHSVWVKCREHISLLVILCIIMYVTNTFLFSSKQNIFFTKPRSDYGKMLKYRGKYR